MITRPKLDKTINNAEDLLNQNDIEWGIGEGYGVEESMRQAKIGSTQRNLIEQGDYESKHKYYYTLSDKILTFLNLGSPSNMTS